MKIKISWVRGEWRVKGRKAAEAVADAGIDVAVYGDGEADALVAEITEAIQEGRIEVDEDSSIEIG